MGTRHLIVVISDGEMRIAQYGQWDGHFCSTGVCIAEIIREFFNTDEKIAYYKGKLKKCRFYQKEEVEKIEEELYQGKDTAPYRDARIFYSHHPNIDRDTGSDILRLVHELTQQDKEFPVRNSIDFAKDPLFCEYAYVLDFDKKILELYVGYAPKSADKPTLEENERFYPDGVKFVRAVPFDGISKETILNVEREWFHLDEEEEEEAEAEA